MQHWPAAEQAALAFTQLGPPHLPAMQGSPFAHWSLEEQLPPAGVAAAHLLLTHT